MKNFSRSLRFISFFLSQYLKVYHSMLLVSMIFLFFSCTQSDENDRTVAPSTNSESQTDNNSESTPASICPAGFVLIPYDIEVGTTKDFCVMKYEAKNNGLGVAVAQASGDPYVSLTIEESRTKCTDLNELNGVSNKYDLISNPEWMTIARNAERVSSNFEAGVMARGWAANLSYGDTWTNSAVAPATDSNCLYNTGEDTCGASGDHLYRRTLTLTNGEEIWDLSGNVMEWVDWSDKSSGLDLGPTTCSSSWVEFPIAMTYDCLSELENQVFPVTPSGSSVEGLGKFRGGVGGATLRGGSWHYGSLAGAFTLFLNASTSNLGPTVGFRCVYRP